MSLTWRRTSRLEKNLVPVTMIELRCCYGPSALWPTFAERERKRKSAIPVGMTERKEGKPKSTG